MCHALFHQKLDFLLDLQKAVPCPALIKVHDEEFVSLLLMPCACSQRELDFSGPLDPHSGVQLGRVVADVLDGLRRSCTCGKAPYAPATAGMGLDDPRLAVLQDRQA